MIHFTFALERFVVTSTSCAGQLNKCRTKQTEAGLLTTLPAPCMQKLETWLSDQPLMEEMVIPLQILFHALRKPVF
jgi:hypothetical protein